MNTAMRSIAALALAGALLAGCGDDDDDAGTDDTTTTSAEESTAAADETEETTTTTEAVAETTTTTAAVADTTTTAAAAELDTSDPDVAGVVEAYTTVFDSSVAAAEKEPYLPEFAALEPVLGQFATAAGALGGVTVDVTDVAVDGDAATATFDILAGGAPYAEDFSGAAVRTDTGWGIPQDDVCTLFGYAQITC
ncbi:MAG: hypothetical protein S0880_33585 [Actinomycetota bacterium]|nr:hypothetical protein [Actinomycetota bacterium]